MPQFICSSCSTGLYSAARLDDLTDAGCPACGAQSALIRPASDDHRRIAERFGAFMDRGRLGQARLVADRWLDDGGSFSPAAVASAPRGGGT